MADKLLVAQIIALIASIILILIQNRGAGLSSSFGGSDEIYLTKRGIEKSVVTMASISIAAFVILRVVSLYIV